MYLWNIKAYINIHMLPQTYTIFFLSNLYLNQGIVYVYVTVDYISIDFLEMQGSEARITKWNIKVCLWNTDYAPGGNKVQKSNF